MQDRFEKVVENVHNIDCLRHMKGSLSALAGEKLRADLPSKSGSDVCDEFNEVRSRSKTKKITMCGKSSIDDRNSSGNTTSRVLR